MKVIVNADFLCAKCHGLLVKVLGADDNVVVKHHTSNCEFTGRTFLVEPITLKEVEG